MFRFLVSGLKVQRSDKGRKRRCDKRQRKKRRSSSEEKGKMPVRKKENANEEKGKGKKQRRRRDRPQCTQYTTFFHHYQGHFYELE